jgi:photosystem I P700 chlorophyll a apoprotein A1
MIQCSFSPSICSLIRQFNYNLFFAQWIQNIHLLAPGTTAQNALATTSYALVGSCIGGKIAMMPIQLGTADFMVHHIMHLHPRNSFNFIKRCLYARSSN